MMPAAKMMDPLLGLDIHMIQPPGPVPPLPIPHPFVGLLFDPMDLVPIVGATVMVNGMPRGIAGTAAKAVPPHIPIGGMFVPPPPGNEGEMFMGSATVQMDGDPASYLALPALTCQTIGMPAPFRMNPKKKTKMKSLQLPLSVVLPIPMGLPVLVGGPPTISMMGMLQKLGMAGLGKAMKKLKKAMKASKKVKAVSDRIHKAANKAMKKLGVPPSVQNKVHKGICTVTGHPVDVATGKVFTECLDFTIGGDHPIRWERTWYSSSSYRGPLGQGWHHPYDLALAVDAKTAVIRMPDGRPVAFPSLRAGERHFLRSEKSELRRDAEGYALAIRGGLTYRFASTAQPDGIFALAKIESPAGAPLEFDYDPAGRLSGIRTSGGRRLAFMRDDLDRIEEIRFAPSFQSEAGMIMARYRYDDHGDMVEATDPNGKSWRYAYRNHLLIKETNRTGLCFHFEYEEGESGARCVRTYGDGGLIERNLAYDTTTRTTRVTDGLGCVTLHRWNDQGLVVETTDPMGATNKVVYNETNEVVDEIDALGQSMRFEYDGDGNCVGISGPDGATLMTRFEDGRPVTAIDALGGEYAWEYDAAGNVIRKTDPLGQATLFEYSGPHLIRKIEPNGAVTSFAYDDCGNATEMRLPDATVLKWRFDRLGRCIESIDASGNSKKRFFDACGRLVRSEEPDGNVRIMQYDGEGNIVLAKDANREVRFTYRGLNRTATRIENGARIEFEYDSEDRVTAIRNEAGHLHSFTLDGNGDVVSERDFTGAEKRLIRDIKGRIIRIERDGGRISKYEYDFGDRVVSIAHGEEYVETRHYRSDGMLMAAANPSTKVVFERDKLGRVLKESSDGKWVSSSYDATGYRSGFASSFGIKLDYVRNEIGEIDGISTEGPSGTAPWSAAFRRDTWGRELERTVPGGLKSIWKRDRLGRPIESTFLEPGKARFRQYAWRTGERLESLQDSSWGSTLFGYDPVGNLVWGLGEKGRARRRIADEVGNIFDSEDRSDRLYGPGGQLFETRSASGKAAYAYDAEGNLTRKTEPDGKVYAYHWDPAGRLERVDRPDGDSVTFAYDALGRRIRKSFRNITTKWVWDGAFPLHEWQESGPSKPKPPSKTDVVPPVQANGNEPGTEKSPITWIFDRASHSPAAKLVGGAGFSIFSDHLGTPLTMFDSQGKEIWSAKLDIYGKIEELKGDGGACPFRFPGHREDEETGLYYNRYRYYDPDTGRYISKDPIGLSGGLRPYAYVSDPNMEVDYFGLAFQRPYDQPETSQILDDSEGRPSPTNPSKDGHARDTHVGQTNQQMMDRVKPGAGGPSRTSTFESAQAQDRAATQALNSPEGQAKLAELDADPTKKRVVIEADTGPETMRNAKRNRGYIVKENSRKTVVVVDALDRTPGAEKIHIQTCHPK